MQMQSEIWDINLQYLFFYAETKNEMKMKKICEM